jgi:ABC-type amino acid transport substrate-binding protein
MSFPEFPPYASFEDGVAKGKCVEFVKNKLGKKYNLKFKSFPWTRAISSLKSGAIDSIGCLSFSEKRKAFAIFSDPIFKINVLVIKKRGNPLKVNSVSDLKKYEGVVVRGDSSAEYYFANRLHQVATVKSLLKFLLMERATVGVLPEEIFNENIIFFSNLQQSQLTTRTLYSEDVYMVISKKSHFKNEIKEINELLSR